MTIHKLERWLTYLQYILAITLSIAFFLPLYISQGDRELHYPDSDSWYFYFWAIPIVLAISNLSNRWLKAVLCLVSIAYGVFSYVLISFDATFKRDPRIGFTLAGGSIIVLGFCWLVLCFIALLRPKLDEIEM